MASKAAILDGYNEHLEKRRGRPKKEGVERYPSGQIKREPKLMEHEKQRNMATATEARMRHNGLTKRKDAQSQEMGYALGRLYLAGALGTGKKATEAAAMLEAGNRMGLDYDRYYRLTGIPAPNPTAMDFGKVRGRGGDADPKDARDASNRMMAVEKALGCADTAGRPVTSLCKRIVLQNENAQNWTPFMVGQLIRGLKALVEHYRIGKA